MTPTVSYRANGLTPRKHELAAMENKPLVTPNPRSVDIALVIGGPCGALDLQVSTTRTDKVPMALSPNSSASALIGYRRRSHRPLSMSRSRRWARLIGAAIPCALLMAACVGTDEREIAEAGDAQVERHTDNPIATELELEGLELLPRYPQRLAGERTGGDSLIIGFDRGGIRDTRFTFHYDLAGATTAQQVLDAATEHFLALGATLQTDTPTERVFTATSLGDDLTITITDRGGLNSFDIGHVVEIHLHDE